MRSIGWIAVSCWFALLVIVGHGSAQDVCGLFQTAPDSSAEYSYHDGSLRNVLLPLDVRFEISCQDFVLDAVIHSPIIGWDENGNEIFPTGLSIPLPISAPYDNTLDYYGTLLETQYQFQWAFANVNEGTIWNGTIGWAGGRFEQTDIVDVELLPVPECTSWTLLALGFPLMFCLRRVSGCR